MDLDISQVVQLAGDLEQSAGRVEDGARGATTAALEASASTMRLYAPVRTGAMRSSIGYDVDSDGLGGEVGPTVDYARFVDQGTSVMPPQPFSGSGADAGGQALETGIGRAVDVALR